MAATPAKCFRVTLLLVYVFWVVMCTVSGETCEKIDVCSCKLTSGKKVSLWDVDEGSNKPSFTGIPQDKSGNKFDWSPCSPFSKSPGCSDVLVCQFAGKYYTTGTISTSFTVDGSGNVVVTYGSFEQDSYVRQTKITLKCDPKQKGKGSIPRLNQTKEEGSKKSIYSGRFTSKYSCPVSRRLSVGSILLITFFCLVIVYLIAGVLINRYYRGTRNFPEILPNSSFWADFPFLVKDGIVFTFLAVKFGCRSLCNKNSYSEI